MPEFIISGSHKKVQSCTPARLSFIVQSNSLHSHGHPSWTGAIIVLNNQLQTDMHRKWSQLHVFAQYCVHKCLRSHIQPHRWWCWGNVSRVIMFCGRKLDELMGSVSGGCLVNPHVNGQKNGNEWWQMKLEDTHTSVKHAFKIPIKQVSQLNGCRAE